MLQRGAETWGGTSAQVEQGQVTIIPRGRAEDMAVGAGDRRPGAGGSDVRAASAAETEEEEALVGAEERGVVWATHCGNL